jgi:hypothetical protein
MVVTLSTVTECPYRMSETHLTNDMFRFVMVKTCTVIFNDFSPKMTCHLIYNTKIQNSNSKFQILVMKSNSYHKTSLKIPKRSSEAINRRRPSNIMVQRKKMKIKQWLKNHFTEN